MMLKPMVRRVFSGVAVCVLTVAAAVVPAGPASAAYVECFGYPGRMRDKTAKMVAEWGTGTAQECFVIAPDRTIWHTWRNAGGWYPVRADGRADFMFAVDRYHSSSGARYRMVMVLVNTAAGQLVYCSWLVGSTWQSWQLEHRC
jgi:hypothetical protein